MATNSGTNKTGATKPRARTRPAPKPDIFPPLTAEERARMVRHGLTEGDIARHPALRYAGVFKDDPDFFEPLREYYRETRGRDLPE